MNRRFLASSIAILVLLLTVLTIHPNVATANDPSGSGVVQQSGGSGVPYPWYYCYWWEYPWCYPYYWWYYPSYYPAPTVETPKTFELKVETNPSGVVSVIGAGTYNQGAAASFRLTSLIIPLGQDQRYVFSHWSGDFSGTAPSGTVIMDSAKAVVANYELQSYLKVTVDPPGLTATVGEGWYSSAESVGIPALPSMIPGTEGSRYVFRHWTIDNVPVLGGPVQVVMETPHIVVAHYKTQYLLTAVSEYGVVQGGRWYDAGSSATFSVTTEVETSYGVKQVFERWIGDLVSTSSIVTVRMDSPVTVRAVWRTDSTILYLTIAAVVGAVLLVAIALTVIAVTRLRGHEVVPQAPARVKRAGAMKPVSPVTPVAQKVKGAPIKKKLKPAQTTEEPARSPQT